MGKRGVSLSQITAYPFPHFGDTYILLTVTGPYMHNGMFKKLGEVITFYNEPDIIVPDAINRDSLMAKPLGLTAQEKSDLEAFLISLTDKRFHNLLDKHK